MKQAIGMKEEIHQLNETITSLSNDVNALIASIENVQGAIGDITGQMDDVRSEVSSFNSAINYIGGHLSSVQQTVNEIIHGHEVLVVFRSKSTVDLGKGGRPYVWLCIRCSMKVGTGIIRCTNLGVANQEIWGAYDFNHTESFKKLGSSDVSQFSCNAKMILHGIYQIGSLMSDFYNCNKVIMDGALHYGYHNIINPGTNNSHNPYIFMVFGQNSPSSEPDYTYLTDSQITAMISSGVSVFELVIYD